VAPRRERLRRFTAGQRAELEHQSARSSYRCSTRTKRLRSGNRRADLIPASPAHRSKNSRQVAGPAATQVAGRIAFTQHTPVPDSPLNSSDWQRTGVCGEKLTAAIREISRLRRARDTSDNHRTLYVAKCSQENPGPRHFSQNGAASRMAASLACLACAGVTVGRGANHGLSSVASRESGVT
jgi:hypothetical protein